MLYWGIPNPTMLYWGIPKISPQCNKYFGVCQMSLVYHTHHNSEPVQTRLVPLLLINELLKTIET